MEAGPDGFFPAVPPHIPPLRIIIGEPIGDAVPARRERLVDPGESFEFGRASGPGQIGADDATMSRAHGLITNYRDHWEVTSTGSYVGFVLHDSMSDDCMEIPAGGGPLTVPYRSALIVIPASRRHVLAVETTHEPGYAYRPAMSSITDQPATAASAQEGLDRRGRPLPWFQALIALCEPRIRHRGGLAAPRSSTDLARRLAVSVESIEHALAEARSRLGFDHDGELTRVAMMRTAVHESIVRTEHLDLLPPASS